MTEATQLPELYESNIRKFIAIIERENKDYKVIHLGRGGAFKRTDSGTFDGWAIFNSSLYEQDSHRHVVDFQLKISGWSGEAPYANFFAPLDSEVARLNGPGLVAEIKTRIKL